MGERVLSFVASPLPCSPRLCCVQLPQDDMVVGQLMRDFSTASRMISVAPAHSLAGDLEPDGRRFGYVRNLVTLDEFIWDRGADSLVVPHLPVPVPQLYRLLAVCKGAFLFFIISATAAMFFRALITSGVHYMFSVLGYHSLLSPPLVRDGDDVFVHVVLSPVGIVARAFSAPVRLISLVSLLCALLVFYLLACHFLGKSGSGPTSKSFGAFSSLPGS